MIHFACSNCGKRVFTSASAAGKTGRCPFCKTLQAIPHAFEVALAESLAAPDEVALPQRHHEMPDPAAPNAHTEPPKKMYRRYAAADAGPQRRVSINMGKK
jgi:hypothetical protein